MIPQDVVDAFRRGCSDYKALRGDIRFGSYNEREADYAFIVRFWMHYAWSAFCLQWVAISWAAVVGKESP